MSNITALQAHVGRRESRRDHSAVDTLNALAATLDDPRRFEPGMTVPPLWHWIFFKPDAAQAQLREDGHPRAGNLLPAVDLPRRMWAGSRLSIARPLKVCHDLIRASSVDKVVEKQGKDGRLLFITLRHTLSDESGIAIAEEQDLVYRDTSTAGSDRQAPAEPNLPIAQSWEWHDELQPTTAMLFRYSALTFNAHRIHYDLPYAQTVEHYPGLVVHGPLIATLLLQSAARALPSATITSIHYRAKRPLFATTTAHLKGRRTSPRTVALWAHDADGCVCATLDLQIEPS